MKQLRTHQVNALNALSTAIRGIINLPTGSGKTLIQSRAIMNAIIGSNGEPKVYVVLSPRILLSNQLMGDVHRDLGENGQDVQRLVVHSGQFDDTYNEWEVEQNLPFRDVTRSLKRDDIIDAWERAQREGIPLLISGTYHSAARVQAAGIPIEAVFCDEAHYLVQEQFAWIVSNPFPANRAYYFTATLRETPSTDGMGMNNTCLFGDILYQEKPVSLITAGEMVRPRMHVVDMSHDPEADEADGLAVAEAFEEHRSLLNIGAKMLVVAKDGSRQLDSLASHPEVLRLQEVRPRLRVFDISTEHGARINGEPVKRDRFLTELRSMDDADEAIIIHRDILSEGIDVPGITGVMPLSSLRKAKFLQTLGRATRLHGNDRNRLYSLTLAADNLRRFIKPYAWLIIPIYGEIGEDLYEDMKEMVRELRDHGFNPAEDIVVKQKRGKRQPVQIETVNEPTRAVRSLLNFTGTVMHELEAEEEADRLNAEVDAFAVKALSERIDAISALLG